MEQQIQVSYTKCKSPGKISVNSLQRDREYKVINAPDVGKHLSATDNTFLQRILSALNIKELDIMVPTVMLDKYQQTEDTENAFLGTIESDNGKQWLSTIVLKLSLS